MAGPISKEKWESALSDKTRETRNPTTPVEQMVVFEMENDTAYIFDCSEQHKRGSACRLGAILNSAATNNGFRIRIKHVDGELWILKGSRTK